MLPFHGKKNNRQHIFSSSTEMKLMKILTIKLKRGSTVFSVGTSKKKRGLQVLGDCGSIVVLGCNNNQTCVSIWDCHFRYFWNCNAVGSQSFYVFIRLN